MAATKYYRVLLTTPLEDLQNSIFKDVYLKEVMLEDKILGVLFGVSIFKGVYQIVKNSEGELITDKDIVLHSIQNYFKDIMNDFSCKVTLVPVSGSNINFNLFNDTVKESLMALEK